MVEVYIKIVMAKDISIAMVKYITNKHSGKHRNGIQYNMVTTLWARHYFGKNVLFITATCTSLKLERLF